MGMSKLGKVVVAGIATVGIGGAAVGGAATASAAPQIPTGPSAVIDQFKQVPDEIGVPDEEAPAEAGTWDEMATMNQANVPDEIGSPTRMQRNRSRTPSASMSCCDPATSVVA